MHLGSACLWGLLGAALIEAWDLYGLIHEVKGFPWRQGDQLKLAPYLVATMIRLGVGTGLAAIFADAHQVAGALGAASVGIAAPKILQEIAKKGLPSKSFDAAKNPSSIGSIDRVEPHLATGPSSGSAAGTPDVLLQGEG